MLVRASVEGGREMAVRSGVRARAGEEAKGPMKNTRQRMECELSGIICRKINLRHKKMQEEKGSGVWTFSNSFFNTPCNDGKECNLSTAPTQTALCATNENQLFRPQIFTKYLTRQELKSKERPAR